MAFETMLSKGMFRPEYFSTDWTGDLDAFQMFSLDVILDHYLLFCRLPAYFAVEKSVLSPLNMLVHFSIKVLFLFFRHRNLVIIISQWC